VDLEKKENHITNEQDRKENEIIAITTRKKIENEESYKIHFK